MSWCPTLRAATAFYLGTVGAAVGLGSIWRFPYLAGTLAYACKFTLGTSAGLRE